MNYLPLKRTLDVIFAAFFLIALAPVLLILALLIVLESKGPVIFAQERLGLEGKPFKIYKFRSMVTGADKIGTGHYSFKGDPRVTRVGRIIRLTSLDELPQFVNVLKGDMSIIGPRPPLPNHPYPYADYKESDKARFSVRPGITGWAQIHGRKEITWPERIAYDLEYVARLSFGLDFKIAIRTIGKLILMSDNVNVKKTV